MNATYAPLTCRSNFSFLEGASHPDELVERVHELGLPALALADRDGVYGAVRAHVKAKELGVHLVQGSRVTIDDGSTITLLCADRGGYANLCRLISTGRLRRPKGECSVSWDEVASHATGLMALWGGSGSLLGAAEEPTAVAGILREAFGDRLYALVTRHRHAEEVMVETRARERARRAGLLTVAGNEVLYHSPARRDVQDVLTCIRHRTQLSLAGRRIQPNAEHDLKSPEAMRELFADDPASLQRTVEVAERCRFTLSEIRYRYPSEKLPDGRTSAEHLRHLTAAGARARYPHGVPAAVREQVGKELALIDELDYCGYFLTMWEIVQFCRRQAILCQGRGSAANSAVCYCLGITAVNPARVDLLFERFLSRERAEPPDIDLDISHERREEVIQHVYATYGRDHAAMVANVIRYRARSAVREVGKALGIPETAVDRLSKLLGYVDAVDRDALAQAGLDPDNPVHLHLLRLGGEIQEFPRHLSIHPGGFLLGHEPVHDLVPIENATMEARTVIQWDKDDIEDLGLFKVDLLGLGALTQLDLAFRLIESHYGKALSMATIPDGDAATFDDICRGDTVGVFQIESRAQMAMLPRLRPRTYYDLVIEVSIVRPGPITGGMVHPYLRRRRGEESVTYPHACLEPVLEKTLGVPLFQEQVMKLAMVAADYTPGEADQLRRDMAAWRRSGRIVRHRDRLVTRMEAKGIAREFAEAVFEQIKGFGEYGFPESHAASFALIAYATAWLHTHHPDVFTCSLLNAQPMGFYSAATLVQDAIRHGVEVQPVDVARSGWHCTLVPRRRAAREGEKARFAILMGLRYVKGLSEGRDWPRIDAARRAASFADVDDLAARTGLDELQLSRLAESGALEGLAPSRRAALWQARGAARRREATLPIAAAEDEVTPELARLSRLDTTLWDYETMDHSPRGHPLEPFRDALAARGLPDARTVHHLAHGRRVSYAGIVICRQRPGTASGVTFMTLEDETGFVNLVLWRQVFERHRLLVKTASFLGVTGKLQVEQGVVHVIAESLWRPSLDTRPARTRSRDFH